jgi:hypothetical protein
MMMDFSDVRASFFAGLSTINVRRTPEKNNGIWGSPSLILSERYPIEPISETN